MVFKVKHADMRSQLVRTAGMFGISLKHKQALRKRPRKNSVRQRGCCDHNRRPGGEGLDYFHYPVLWSAETM